MAKHISLSRLNRTGLGKKMEKIMKICENINNVFEDIYINKSIVIANSPKEIYHVYTILEQQNYPIEILHDDHFKEILDRFTNGNIRMMIMSDLMFYVLRTHWNSCLDDVSVYFLTDGVNIQGFETVNKIIFV